MIKELKYLFFILTIFVFIFLILKYYFSDNNKKNSYRSLVNIDKKIEIRASLFRSLKRKPTLVTRSRKKRARAKMVPTNERA